MTITPRLIGGIYRTRLLFAACTIACLPALAQGAGSANPLRRVDSPRVFEEPKPAETTVIKSVVAKSVVTESEPKVDPEVKPASNTEVVVGEPRVMTLPSKKVVRSRSQVRTARAGIFPHIRQPFGYGPPPAATFETKVTGPAVPALSAENGGVPGEIIYEGEMIDGSGGVMYDDTCAECGNVGCYDCCAPCSPISFRDTEIFLGVHGNTGPRNRGQSGSFGFHEGFNWGTPFPMTYGSMGVQVGMRATQSNISGADFTDSSRRQIFLTGGLFRRVDWGLQGGVVVDYLSEDWYSSIDVVQLRGELSWVFPCSHEFGFWFAAHANSDIKTPVLTGVTTSTAEEWQATDLYAFFYRRRYECLSGAESRIFAGFTGESDGFIGADARLPLGTNWALETEFAYLVPNEGTGTAGGGHAEEGWNIAISLVWYPGCPNFGGCDYYRPLFDVAGNGSFMLDQL